MSTSPRAQVGRDRAVRRYDDRGSTLVLVLLLVVIAGLVVVPLMRYATSVLRLNTEVSERTKDIEAAKSGLRVAMQDPFHVFSTCDGGGSLDSVDLNGTTVVTSCAELSEFGPIDALGFEVPVGAVAAQLGAEVPSTAVGGTMQSDPVPSYPAAADWWSAHLPDAALGYDAFDAANGAIWMPGLPAQPSETRSATPFDALPTFTTDSGIECKVFFPGQYDQPLVLGNDTTTGAPVYYYFASGVYYFEQSITVHENADVVVGLGLADFADRAESEQSECAADLQIVNGVVGGPTVPAIDGFGATWVFGDDAQLIVDDSAGSPSIRFNQRYAEADRGGRISIMTVNGVKNGSAADDHDVPLVNLIPGSLELDTIDPDNDVSVASPINADRYMPSDPRFTDAARPPAAPALSVVGRKYRPGPSGALGALLLTWSEPRHNDAGGSLITGYDVVATRTNGPGAPETFTICDQPGDIVFSAGAGPSGDNELSCYAGGLALGRNYEVSVVATNAVGSGPPGIGSANTPEPAFGSNDARPDAPTGVTLDDTDVDGVARIGWTPGASPDVPINGYTATLSKIVGAAEHPELPPRMFFSTPSYVELIGYSPIGYRIATVDPNGEDPTLLSLDLSGVPAGWDVQATSQIDLLITPPPTGAPTPFDTGVFFPVDYTVTDQDGLAVTKNLTIGWVGNYSGGVSPDPDAKTFDAYVSASPSSPSVFELPFTHARGEAASVTADTIASLPPGWNATRTGNALSVWTSLTDGSTTDMTFTVTDNDGGLDTATITLIAPTGTTTLQPVDTCTVVADPWFPVAEQCEIADVDDLVAGESGFVASVVANSVIGDSAPSANSPTRGTNFEGGGTAAPPAPERVVDPWTPEPIIDIRAGSANAATVRIAGYVAIPMGRIHIDNPDGADVSDTIEVVGGIISGTYDLNDDDDDTVIGFLNDIVLQRKVRITSVAGNARSVAVVQVNEDGDYAINSWVVN